MYWLKIIQVDGNIRSRNLKACLVRMIMYLSYYLGKDIVSYDTYQ